ncbi:MAG: hypothetical protein CVV17_00730, partial [Gammaproteobacteria bacterium HGW-Gammaproteobacteria-7]
MALRRLDAHLLHPPALADLSGPRRFALEFVWFGIKEARSCLFAGLIFAAILLVPREGAWLLPRYDALLLIALIIQAWLLRSGLESVDEAKAIGLFHLIGFALEAYKVSPAIGSWSYPDPAWTKVLGVPLFAGFMYAAVGSYIIQAWRLLDVRIRHHPPYWLATLIALLMIFVVMAALFESLLFPAAILSGILFSALGVFWLFWLTGTTFSIMAAIGILVLMGVVVNNGIVMIEHINNLRREGLPRTEALVAGGRERLRPILMTVGTTLL